MKICILTQSLQTNYGGILQAYALQTVLKRMGHEVVTDRHGAPFSKPISLPKRIIHFGYHFIKRFFLQDIHYNPFRFLFSSHKHRLEIRQKQIALHIYRFVDTHMHTIDFFQGKQTPPQKMLDQFEALVVGSDQIWRPAYSYVPAYFLDFAKGKAIRRVAYAASFGVNDWTFTPVTTTICATLAKQFDAISVREDSGVELCRTHLNVEAQHLLDPTLLLEKNDYLQIIEEREEEVCTKRIMCYILDQSPETQEVVCRISSKLELSPLEIMPKKKFTAKTTDVSGCVYPSVSEWIIGFRDAAFVITDSFHGTIFALIFNKPFVVISNSKRGAARLTSLLRIFSLENHILYSPEELSDQHLLPIDYVRVNQVKKECQQKSLDFLKRHTQQH